MSYTKHNFTSGSHLYASQLNEMDNQISANESKNASLENMILSEPYQAEVITDIGMTGVFTVGSVTTQGVIREDLNTQRYTKFDVKYGDVIYTESQTTPLWCVTPFNGNTCVSDKSERNVYTYTVPYGVDSVYVTIYGNMYRVENTLLLKRVETKQDNKLDEIQKIKDVVYSKETRRKTVSLYTYNGWSVGIVRKNGQIDTTYTDYRYIHIDVSEGDIIKTSSQSSPLWSVVAYNGDVLSADNSYINKYSYTVPSGVDNVYVTVYLNQMTIENTCDYTYEETVYIEKTEQLQNTNQHTHREPRITFIDDDGYKEFYTYLVPIMRKYNIPMVSAYMGDFAPDFNHRLCMTKEECDEVVSLGGELVVHGATKLTNFSTVEEAEENVLTSKENIEKMGFKSGTHIYVYPESGNNVAIREMISKHFKCGIKTGYPQKGDGRCNDKCVPSYFVHRSSWGGYYDDRNAPYTSIANTHSLEYMKALIDEANNNNSWLVVMLHAWMMPVGCSYRLAHDETNGIDANLDEFALLESAIEYVEELQESGSKIKIVTASEGFEMFGNAMQSGDYLGYWNEDTETRTTSSGVVVYEHNKGGFAVNKLGDVDFPTTNKITH